MSESLLGYMDRITKTFTVKAQQNIVNVLVESDLTIMNIPDRTHSKVFDC